MANYVKTVDFAAKDALPTGNPSKIASGTQVDTELNNIATAIATKEDTANKGVANGYAELNSSGDVPDGQISQSSITQHQASLSIAGSQLTDDTVTNAKLADMAQATVKGRLSGSGTGNPVDLTAGQLIDIIETADGSGSGLDADTVDGQHASAFSLSGHTHGQESIFSISTAVAQAALNGQSIPGYARNISGKGGVTKTLSSSSPSGGSDGDIWYQY